MAGRRPVLEPQSEGPTSVCSGAFWRTSSSCHPVPALLADVASCRVTAWLALHLTTSLAIAMALRPAQAEEDAACCIWIVLPDCGLELLKQLGHIFRRQV